MLTLKLLFVLILALETAVMHYSAHGGRPASGLLGSGRAGIQLEDHYGARSNGNGSSVCRGQQTRLNRGARVPGAYRHPEGNYPSLGRGPTASDSNSSGSNSTSTGLGGPGVSFNSGMASGSGFGYGYGSGFNSSGYGVQTPAHGSRSAYPVYNSNGNSRFMGGPSSALSALDATLGMRGRTPLRDANGNPLHAEPGMLMSDSIGGADQQPNGSSSPHSVPLRDTQGNIVCDEDGHVVMASGPTSDDIRWTQPRHDENGHLLERLTPRQIKYAKDLEAMYV